MSEIFGLSDAMREQIAIRQHQERVFKNRHGYDWPDCQTPDCGNKACVPSDLCHPCSLRVYGIDYRPRRT